MYVFQEKVSVVCQEIFMLGFSIFELAVALQKTLRNSQRK
jgi:hypothetical protein